LRCATVLSENLYARIVAKGTRNKSKAPDDDRIVLTDPKSIRAIAHPARLKVIDHLFQGNVSTSTELAELTGLSASAMSYHLRSLEKWGIVARVDDAADGRERPWRQAGSGLSWTNSNAAEIGPLSVMMKQFFNEMEQQLADWQRFEPQAPLDWKHRSTVSRGFPWLTAEQASQFAEGVAALLENIGARTHATAPPDAQRTAYLFALVPLVDQFEATVSKTKKRT
jgi:DNA-binding transcriptional ArsR family regulator